MGVLTLASELVCCKSDINQLAVANYSSANITLFGFILS